MSAVPGSKQSLLTHAYLKTHLAYNPATGLFTRLVRTPRGAAAGRLTREGYITVCINGKQFLAHRLAWFYVHKIWPEHDIDHINGTPDDNRLLNLREATRTQNQMNTRRRNDNTSGYKGVYWVESIQRWRAQCRLAGKRHSLGLFSSADDAHHAYREFAMLHHGEFYRASA